VTVHVIDVTELDTPLYKGFFWSCSCGENDAECVAEADDAWERGKAHRRAAGQAA
jgi:hypothetical protein